MRVMPYAVSIGWGLIDYVRCPLKRALLVVEGRKEGRAKER